MPGPSHNLQKQARLPPRKRKDRCFVLLENGRGQRCLLERGIFSSCPLSKMIKSCTLRAVQGSGAVQGIPLKARSQNP